MSTKVLNIGLDFDNTLVYSKEDVVKRAAKELGVRVSIPKTRDYNFSNIPENIKVKIFKLFKDPVFATNLEVIPGAIKKLNQWKKDGHNLFIITARDPEIREATGNFIRAHFPMIDSINYVKMGWSKKRPFKSLELDVWVDDSPIDTVTAADMGIKTCLISNSSTAYNFYLKKTPVTNISIYDKISNINFY